MANILDKGTSGNDLFNSATQVLNFKVGFNDDFVYANAGDDTIVASAGTDFLDGGDGNDWVSFETATTAVTVSLVTGIATGSFPGEKTPIASTSYLKNIENIIGGALADKVSGDASNNILNGNAGNDTLDGGDGWDIVSYEKIGTQVPTSGVNIDLSASPGKVTSAFFGNDTLINIEEIWGSELADTIKGDKGNNKFKGGLGNDSIDGGDGIDTCIYDVTGSFKSEKTISGQIIVAQVYTGAGSKVINETDILTNIERIGFSGTKQAKAFDINGNAGSIVKLVTAVFGDPEFNANKITNDVYQKYIGIGLQLMDSGTSYADLMAIAIDYVGARTSEAVVDLLWGNVMGSTATAQQKTPFIGLLNSGTSVASFGVAVADSIFNTAHIDMVGINKTGLDYILP